LAIKLGAKILIATAGFGWLVGCNDLEIVHTAPAAPAGTGSVTLATASATIETPSTVQLSGGFLSLKATGTGSWGCTFVSGGTVDANTGTSLTAGEPLQNLAYSQANLFTTPSYMKVTGLTLRIRRTGGPSGNMYTELRAGSGASPTGASLANSNNVLISSIATTGVAGHLIAFTLPTAVEMPAGATYAVLLQPQSGSTVDGANYFGWVVTNNNSPEGCTGFPVYRYSSDSATTWGNGSGTGYGRGYFTIQAEQHASSGTVSWIGTAPSPSSSWIMSSFSFSENPASLTGGTILYDIGVGSDPAVPNYSQTGLTKAQVRALSDLTGQYLYVRAMLSVGSPQFDNAVLGAGGINYQ
jgi:hypothetical protein